MKQYIKVDEWNIIEEGFVPGYNKISESIFSLGNGRMGQRGNFEETYSGETLQGSYVAGIYYPDKTRVGWWKNGYPEYFAKVLNAANWIGLEIRIEGEVLDLHHATVSDFRRVLNMKEGYLERTFTATLASGKQLAVRATRFCSIVDDEAGALRYSITPLNFDGQIEITSFIDGGIRNQDSNYDEGFWELVAGSTKGNSAYLTLRTRKTGFDVCTGMQFHVYQAGNQLASAVTAVEKDKFVGGKVSVAVTRNQETVIVKYAANLSSENHSRADLLAECQKVVVAVAAKGFEKLQEEQAAAWAAKWEESDIMITGDAAAQQGIRFNIFQLNQTYTGEDARLNIGPKGFTGEKYGGSTYWDTEAYCIPFYLATAEQQVARNLLVYRYNQLDKAIENAGKLGFNKGAALYPMVTMNGEECHNEWEITFEEIHRNAAIAFAIYNYIRYTGDTAYLAEYGLEVLIGIARFWAQRVNWSEARQQYVMLGVTGPNEYENNVNNNWYTSTMATWCLQYTIEALAHSTDAIIKKTAFDAGTEVAQWQHIIDNMYYPEDAGRGIFLQQDNYLDKEQILVKDLDPVQRPLNQKWSWDRILRSCFIKQADVLQGFYFLEDRFDMDTLRRNFDFYEPRTVHESSLSPCIHAILAAKLGDGERAYEFYLRTSRLDLDDYNNDTEDGLHITSMAGTWMSVVEGFAGMRVRDGQLRFTPFLPESWQSFAFSIRFRKNILKVEIDKHRVVIENKEGGDITVNVFDDTFTVKAGAVVQVNNRNLVS
ncbi:glycoside hydrolase family 65 protein [Chitinophaga sancti]|uniref:Glycoside hydrolase family 65 protein n=1 Tax=Chitinophaga sancti TaxID=1004 RepID=A0A1K1QNE1_9BACT|nr:glycoside hydrolase family 65 protein [Chitinophaga sancti]WQD65094.1 glycoside hydrolase family 65 protein [Chitinophaga sancti]WQG89282.1 glycoside hydrolase family 65 protein [Chitinophaga sancti]SFW61147.1 maltose phosphorylase [Chitinophaga sancti]